MSQFLESAMYYLLDDDEKIEHLTSWKVKEKRQSSSDPDDKALYYVVANSLGKYQNLK
mgnify:CR=1 FL=1